MGDLKKKERERETTQLGGTCGVGVEGILGQEECHKKQERRGRRKETPSNRGIPAAVLGRPIRFRQKFCQSSTVHSFKFNCHIFLCY